MNTSPKNPGEVALSDQQESPAGGSLMRFPDMPPPLIQHPVVGDLFDRIQMQQYAVSFATMNGLLK